MSRSNLNILSIDGGGIKGIIPLVILAELEERTGKRIYEMFDYMGGTSTGGMIALGLSVLPAKDILNLYLTRAWEIFQRSWWPVGPTYKADGIESFLREIFGDMRLSEAKIPTLVTAFDMERDQAFHIYSHPPEIGRYMNDPCDFTFVQAARATSAAPTYFPPAQMKVRSISSEVEESYTFIDGGVFANNPVIQLVGYAAIHDPIFEAKKLNILSLGCGDFPKQYGPGAGGWWTKLQWLSPILHILMTGTGDSADLILEHFYGTSFDRIDGPLLYSSDDLDDIAENNLVNLVKDAENMKKNFEGLLQEWTARGNRRGSNDIN